MPLISVIVPVYKVENYIDRCVSSILAQSFRDFELILVNDGSPDRSGEMCDALAMTDSRIRVFHQENGGQASARNLALDWVLANSDSQWIHFVDSDDYIHPQMLETLLSAANQFNTSISVCRVIVTQGEPLTEQGLDKPISIMTPEQYYTHDSNEASGPCAKLFRKELCREVRFPVGKLYEDAYTLYRLLFQCDRIAYIDWHGYAYYTNLGSTTKRPWSMRRLDVLGAITQQIDYFTQHRNPSMRKFMIRQYMNSLMWQFVEIDELEDKKLAREGRKALKRLGRKALIKYWGDKVFRGESDLWIYKTYFPRLTQLYIYAQALLKKLQRRR